MFIKRLEIYGFKSFPYKVSIPFSSGITAIIGPNGSGKSNIVDAIRWVLGEQSPKKLRVKELSDLIFSGDLKKKIDFAEVKLVIHHELPVWQKFKDVSEVIITRRFYRTGEGEFFINQKPCRLKDIQFLFMDLGVNPQGYGIIEQGEISKFLDLSPKERKIFLEDLAGTLKFKITEEETKKNLKKTKENLIRLEDILKEVEDQYRKLKSQAEEAKKYLALKEKLENLLIKKNLYLFNQLSEKKHKIKREINLILDKIKSLETEIESLGKEEQNIYQGIFRIERELKDLKEERELKEKSFKEWENKFLSLLKEERTLRSKLEKERIKEENQKERLNALNKELEIIENSLKELKNLAEELKNKLNYLKKEKEKYLRLYEEKVKKFKNLERTYITLSKEQEKLKEKKEFIDKRIFLLNKEKQIIKDSLQKVLEEQKKIQLEESTWNTHIEEKKKNIELWENRLEILYKDKHNLEKDLNQLYLEKQKYISEINSLKERIALIDKILARTSSKKKKKNIKLPLLESLLSLTKEEISLLETVFKEDLNAFVVEDLKILKEIDPEENLVLFFKKSGISDFFKIKKFEKLSDEVFSEYEMDPKFIYIKEKKILFTPMGFIYLIRKIKEGTISLKKERTELLSIKEKIKTKLDSLLDQEKQLHHKLKEYNKELETVKKRLLDVKKTWENLIRKKETVKMSLIKLQEQEKTLRERLENIDEEINTLNKEKEVIEKELKLLKEKLSENSTSYKDFKDQKDKLEKKLQDLDKELNFIYQEVVKVKTKDETLKNRKVEIEKNLEKAKNIIKELRFSISIILSNEDYVKNKIKETAKKKDMINRELVELKNKLKILEEKKENLEKNLKERELKRKEIEKELRKLETKKHNLEIILTEVTLQLNTVKKELLEHGISQEPKFEEIKLDFNLEGLEKEIESIKEELKKFDQVNLASIKEFELISKRYKDLLMQKQDVENSIKELTNILKDLKDISKERILKTLKEVNLRLKEVFSTIFPGGEVELKLTEEDPLLAGLDIKIKIPGKNVRHLNMLSGGEKALCVIAILIAFYLVKPSPFCILDEVDASLDEKNSIQFVKLLQLIKKNSQVILITHNPNIMKEVDTLLGVTMEEKGISKIFTVKLRELQKTLKPIS